MRVRLSGMSAVARGAVAALCLSSGAAAAPEPAAPLRRPLPDFGRDDFTVSAWVRTREGGTIVAKAPAKGKWVPQGKALFIRDGRVVYDIGWVGCITSRRGVSDDAWHHVALVQAAGRQTIYIDGAADAEGRLQSRSDAAAWVFKIGRASDNFGGDFRGLLDEVRLYARDLQADEIRALATAAGAFPILRSDDEDARAGIPFGRASGPALPAIPLGAVVGPGRWPGRTNDSRWHASSEMRPTAAAPASDPALAGWWPFEGDGDDASGSANAVELRGRHEFVAGRAGRAVKLAGGSAVAHPPPADPLDALSAHDLPGLRAMIQALGAPSGAEHLARLDELEKRGAAIAEAGGALDAWSGEVAALRRRALVTENPAAGFDKLVFVTRKTYGANHYYTEFINSPWTPGGNLCVLDLKDGSVREIVPQLKGGVFERFDLSFDARRIVFAWKAAPQDGYRIYEVGVDGKGLCQLTFPQADEAALVAKYRVFDHYHHGTDDMQPCYLADGGIAFISTRCQYGILCDGPDDFTTTVLYRMDGDGRNLRRLSNSSVSEASPVLMSDGRLLYTRWEYVDKGAVSVKCLWAMRPDGTASSEVYGNDISLPPTLIYGRPIPGTADGYVVLGTPHYPQNGMGTVIRLDTSRNIRTREPMTSMTPDVDIQAEPGFAFREPDGSWRHDGAGRGRLFKDPFPLSARLFLVSHKPAGPEWKAPDAYGLYLLDEAGRVALLHRGEGISCWMPMPLKPRPVPPVLSSPVDAALAASNRAVCVVADVYQGLGGVERGTVKHLRILEQVPRPWSARRRWDGDVYDQQHATISKDTHLGLKVQHGIVPVESDGSAHFVVPAGANVFFQALDANHMAVQTERTFVNYMPGETRSCVGCHELPGVVAAAAPSASLLAMRRVPSVPGPQPGERAGRRPLDYVLDVQPVWDRHCVKCHGGADPRGKLDLSGAPTAMFNVSYESLVPERRRSPRVDRGLLGPVIGENHPKTGNVDYLPPKSLGSHASVLVAMLARGAVRLADPEHEARARKLAGTHRDVHLTPEELLKVTNWVDTNAQFYGTYFGRKNLAHKSHPAFRPVPTFEMAVSRENPFAE
jgi:hypothetical protein